jgi:hypothetical protein
MVDLQLAAEALEGAGLIPVSQQFCWNQQSWLYQKQRRLKASTRERQWPSSADGSTPSRGSQPTSQNERRAFLSDTGRVERRRGRCLSHASLEGTERGGSDGASAGISRWRGSAAASLASLAPTAPEAPTPPEGNAVLEATERVGVLLLNLGGPESLDDVQPFLYNLFADPVSVPIFLLVVQRTDFLVHRISPRTFLHQSSSRVSFLARYILAFAHCLRGGSGHSCVCPVHERWHRLRTFYVRKHSLSQHVQAFIFQAKSHINSGCRTLIAVLLRMSSLFCRTSSACLAISAFCNARWHSSFLL